MKILLAMAVVGKFTTLWSQVFHPRKRHAMVLVLYLSYREAGGCGRMNKIVRTLRRWLTRVRGAVAPRLRDAEFSRELGRHLQAY